MTILITGGCGFIGSNFIVDFVRNHPEDTIINIDKLSYCGNKENVKEIEDAPNYVFIQADISDREKMNSIFEEHKPSSVIHFAAESHVDRSIQDASPFIITNVLGTQILLDISRNHNIERFIHISTDEVYGSLETDEGFFTEESILAPNSPYAASKAASDLLVRAYIKTHNFPAIITRCSNNYGPKQFPEKIMPLFINNALEGKTLPVYGDGKNIRDWIHVKDHCRAIELVLEKGKIGEIYNIGDHNEKRNIEITKLILENLNLPEDRIEFVIDRPGHDYRYAIDSNKIRKELGWKPEISFDEGFRETVEWYKQKLAVGS